MDRGQIIFLAVAALILLWQTVKGWRLGLVRQIVRFGALAAAYATAFWGGALAVPFLRPLGYPDFVLQALGGAGLGLLAYLFVSLIGGILFKRTAHQDLGLIWFLYGFTGALMGLAFGLVLVLAAADTVRLLGSMVAAPHSVAAKPGKARHPAGLAGAGAAAEPAHANASPLLEGVVELKKSLESGVPGEVLQTLDPVPKKTYTVANKIGRTVADPQAAERFLTFPGAMELAMRPDIQALSRDPEILRAVHEGQYAALLKNPKIVKAANDPKTAALLKQFDLEKALDEALRSKGK